MPIVIKRNDYDEYEVPTPSPDASDSIYYTDDKDDAIATAQHVHGDLVEIVFRSGTYDKEDS